MAVKPGSRGGICRWLGLGTRSECLCFWVAQLAWRSGDHGRVLVNGSWARPDMESVRCLGRLQTLQEITRGGSPENQSWRRCELTPDDLACTLFCQVSATLQRGNRLFTLTLAGGMWSGSTVASLHWRWIRVLISLKLSWNLLMIWHSS